MADDLQTLVDACLVGEEAALQRFVDRYKQRVFGLCWRMLAHRQDAEDAAQETFVRALRNLAKWDRRRPLEPWLLTIAANRCRSALARRARRPPGVPLADDTVAVEHDNLQAARHLAEEVQRALETVRPQYALAFRLFHDQELSYAEIAEICQRPLGTVKTWVHRARKEIVRQLVARKVIDGDEHAMQRDRSEAQRVAG